jgi:HAMP domain-containing protein
VATPQNSRSATSDPAHRSRSSHRRKVALAVVVLLVGIPLALVGACNVTVQVLNARATDRLAQSAQDLMAGTPYAGKPADQLPGYSIGGSVLCMDNCLYLTFDVPAEYAPTIADNVAQAGWTVDIPGCLTSPDRSGPPCGIVDSRGDSVGLASYWPGPNLTVMLGPG